MVRPVEVKFIKVRKVEEPFRKHSTDSGFDFFIPEKDEKLIKDIKIIPERNALQKEMRIEEFVSGSELVIPSGMGLLIPSGLRVILPHGCDLILYPRSSTTMKFGLLVDGVIDSGYTGEFRLPLFNPTRFDIYVEFGGRYVQGIVRRLALPEETFIFSAADEEEFERLAAEKERGSLGFGSTG